MSQGQRTDHLPPAQVQHILLVLGLIMAPHLVRLPLWASLLVVLIGLWRMLAAQRTWPMPPTLLRLGLAVAAFAGIYAQFGTLNGHHAGVSLLVVMLAMKLMEMTQRRDYLFVIFLSYFLLITHFLFSQEMVMMLVLFPGALLITAVLIDVNHARAPLPLTRTLRISGTLLLQAVPLMLLFFLLFPRIPGPLWGIPSDAGAGLTGLSESMEPGMISNLSQSDAVAFRVRFRDQVPARNQLYWRGPVFEFFNGRAWLPGIASSTMRPVDLNFQGPRIEYEMQLEPHGREWMLALDLPSRLPENTTLGPDLVLRHRRKLVDKQLVEVESGLNYTVETALNPRIARINLSLPAQSNPRARALAQSWRETYGDDDQAIVDAALRLFRFEDFVYTLQPPRMLDTHSIDQFLFDARRGFCEHYAGAFTFLMRAAGIPARIVTGYQGAEANADYYIVRQSDAHAWSEVWMESRGWVRVDPTGAVAPDRIELGLGGSLPDGEPVPGLARARINPNLLLNLQLRWDQANALWNRWVLAYGPELQQSLMGALGLPGVRELILALTALSVGVLIAVSLLLARRHRPRQSLDPILRLWRHYLRKLRKAGMSISEQEGPQDLLARLKLEKPAFSEPAEIITRLYVRLRYASHQPDPVLLKALKQRIRRFPNEHQDAPI